MRHATVALLHPSPILKIGIENIILRHKEISATIIDTTAENISAIVLKKHPSIIIADPIMMSSTIIDSLRDIAPDIYIIGLYNSALPQDLVSKFDETISFYDTPEALCHIISNALERDEETTESDRKELSPREKEVVVGIVKGLSNKEIAGSMNVSVNTVMTHRRNISNKLKIHSPAGLTIYAIVSKLVSLEEVSGL